MSVSASTAAVVDGGQLVGMVSVEDVFRALLPSYVAMGRMPNLADVLHDTYFEEAFEKFKNTTVGSVMCREIDSIAPDEPLMNAVALFVRKARKSLPVLDRGKFIGTVTRRSVLAAATKKAQR